MPDPPRDHEDATPWYAERPLLALLALFLPLKLALMLIAQRHLDGDEAVIGVMALHIARGADFPFYFWGQHYGGGSALAAYLTALPFLVVGPSSIAFRLVPMLFSFTAVVLAYRLVQSIHGRLVASVATLLLLTSSALVEWFAKSRGGYVESTVFLLVVLTLLRRLETGAGAPLRVAFAIGLTGGIAYYVQENALPFVAIGCATAVWLQRRQRPLATVAALLGGLAIAVSPVVVYNLLHDWQNLDYVLHASALGRASFAGAVGVAMRKLPALFQPHNFDCYPPTLDARTLLEASVVVTVALITALRTIVAYLRNPSGSVVFATLSAYVILFLAYALLSLRTQTSPRYFFNLAAPMLLLTGICLGDGLASLRRQGVSLRAAVSSTVLVLLVVLGAYSHARAFRVEMVADAVWRKGGALECAWSPGGDLSAVVDFLLRENVAAVRSPYFSQWRIVFESGERIAASSADLVPSESRLPALDRAVAAAPRVAFVLHCSSLHNDQLRRDAPHLTRKRIGDYCVYL